MALKLSQDLKSDLGKNCLGLVPPIFFFDPILFSDNLLNSLIIHALVYYPLEFYDLSVLAVQGPQARPL